MRLKPNDSRCPYDCYQRQFPIALCFAMTINKSQGQTLKKVCLYLPNAVIGHGQLYLSRVTHPDKIKILIDDNDEHMKIFAKDDNTYTKNVVYIDMLIAAGLDLEKKYP